MHLHAFLKINICYIITYQLVLFSAIFYAIICSKKLFIFLTNIAYHKKTVANENTSHLLLAGFNCTNR